MLPPEKVVGLEVRDETVENSRVIDGSNGCLLIS
jgi:hypothetical protein